MKLTKFFDKPFLVALYSLAIPICLQSLFYSSYLMVDMVMVSTMGETAVAAVETTNTALWVAQMLLGGCVGAMSVLVAQHWGAGNKDAIKRCLAISHVVGLALAFPLFVIFTFFPEAIVSLVTDDPNFASDACAYLSVKGPSLLTIPVFFGYCAAMSAIGRAYHGLVISLVASLLNVALNYLLIFGNFGFPQLGLVGAALGTTLSRFLITAFVIAYVHRFERDLILKLRDFASLAERLEVRKFVLLAVPMSIHGVVVSGGMFGYQIIYGQIGVTALAAIAVVAPFIQISIALFEGYATAAGVMLGHSLGANNLNTAWRRGWQTLAVTFVSAILISIVVWYLNLFRMFGALDPSTLELAHGMLVITLVSMWIRGLNMVALNGILKSGGDNRFVLAIEFVALFCIGLPIGCLASFYLKLPALYVFALILLDECFKCVMALGRIRSGRWMKNLVASPAA